MVKRFKYKKKEKTFDVCATKARACENTLQWFVFVVCVYVEKDCWRVLSFIACIDGSWAVGISPSVVPFWVGTLIVLGNDWKCKSCCNVNLVNQKGDSPWAWSRIPAATRSRTSPTGAIFDVVLLKVGTRAAGVATIMRSVPNRCCNVDKIRIDWIMR